MKPHTFNFSQQLAPTGVVDIDVVNAHAHSINHRAAVLRSERCGCFDCLAIFPPEAIDHWTDAVDGVDVTAFCPECGNDTVIGTASGFAIEDWFLRRMREHWLRAAEDADAADDDDQE